ncbi:hypothetical protein BQ8420_05755 [Nocardiopsis sp. JB363]|nr:hypothetical protein BQ8420_05755 [Nocardiopsis sp. JB363]
MATKGTSYPTAGFAFPVRMALVSSLTQAILPTRAVVLYGRRAVIRRPTMGSPPV